MKRLLCFLTALALCLSLWGCGLMPELPLPTSEEPEPSTAPGTAAPTGATEETRPTETEPPTRTEPSTETQPPETEVQLRWEDVYALLLSNLSSSIPMLYNEYYLYDLDGDNSPELFVKQGTCEADTMIELYTMAPAGAERIATLGGSHSMLCGLSGQNACLLATGHQGHESITKLSLRNGQLQQELIYEAYGEEYHQFTGLPGYALSQREGLRWNGNPTDQNQDVLDNHKTRLPYLLRIPFADQSVFSGPSYDERFVQTVEFAGTYTIVEEQYDWEGNLWGKLKSGAGWVDLTDIQYRIDLAAPISANYADRPLLESGAYDYACLDSSEYSFSVAFRAYETLYDVRFYVANLAMDDLYSREVFYLERLSADRPLVAELALPMDLSAYTICFTDSYGYSHTFILTDNGRNNALVFYEY
ncbi:MAG: hypothetical protein IJA48_01910 [Oscillospiraceae bacterium]|nr:hypothetical protein [Oscillospiraceae bacterium]